MDYAIDSYFTEDDVSNNENNEPQTNFIYEYYRLCSY